MDATGTVTIYKNGAIVATGSGQLPNVIARTSNFLGHSNTGTDAYYAGKLDEAAIFNSALAPDRILAHCAGSRLRDQSELM